ncbi:hypothetical protein BDV32DRAFT_131519 [Aspergillus pseudonomiae]|nr:hypothetical protein BDV32DRAFT_131519 [Aspergillus pseudonomiae]
MFMSHDLRFPDCVQSKTHSFLTGHLALSSPSFHLVVIYSRSICEWSHDQTIPQMTFATLWPLPSIPAFGPGM